MFSDICDVRSLTADVYCLYCTCDVSIFITAYFLSGNVHLFVLYCKSTSSVIQQVVSWEECM